MTDPLSTDSPPFSTDLPGSELPSFTGVDIPDISRNSTTSDFPDTEPKLATQDIVITPHIELSSNLSSGLNLTAENEYKTPPVISSDAEENVNLSNSLSSDPGAASPDGDESVPIDELLKLVPWGQVFLFFMVILGDSVAINIIAPFIPEISRTRFGVGEESLGVVSGSLLAAFLFSSFLSSFFIGSISDRVGRKPLILIGLFTSSVTSFLFVISPNMWIALFLRIFAGLTNANIVLSFSGLSDIIFGPPRSIIFAYLGAVFSVGRAVSSFVGGATAGIFLTFLPDGNLWGKNPYLLPGLIGATFNLLTFIISLLFLKESNSDSKRENNNTRVRHLISIGTQYLREDSILRNLSAIYWVNSFCNGSQLLLLILYLSLDTKLRGFGFTATGVGIVLGILGGTGAVYQILFGKHTIVKLGVEKTYKMGVLLLGLPAVFYPVIGSFTHWSSIPADEIESSPVVWTFLVAATVVLSIGFMSGLPILSSILSNVIPQNLQGTLQGFVRSFASLFRSIGPFLVGAIFSGLSHYSVPGFTYLVIVAGYSFCFYKFSKLRDPRFSGKVSAESLELDISSDSASKPALLALGSIHPDVSAIDSDVSDPELQELQPISSS